MHMCSCSHFIMYATKALLFEFTTLVYFNIIWTSRQSLKYMNVVINFGDQFDKGPTKR